MLDDQAGWSFSGPETLTLATIENLENFVRAEVIGVHADIWIYTQGRLSGRMFRWLDSLSCGSGRLIHLGDYDPVGVDEYRKLRESWGDRCSLHIPDDLEYLFKHYSNCGIMEKDANQKVFGRLVEQVSILPLDAQNIMQLIRINGAGLEQEVLSRRGMLTDAHQCVLRTIEPADDV